jgi:hypothetical protein
MVTTSDSTETLEGSDLYSVLPKLWRKIWTDQNRQPSVEARSNTSSVALRVVVGDEKGRLESETVKYGRDSHGTRTLEWLRWREPAAIVNDRPVLTSERALHINKRNSLTAIKIWSYAPDECFIPRQTGRLTVGRNIRLRLRLRTDTQRVHKERVRAERAATVTFRVLLFILTNCYSYSKIESVKINCSSDWWISNKSTHQFKPASKVINTSAYFNTE